MQPDMDAVTAALQSGTLDYRNVTLVRMALPRAC